MSDDGYASPCSLKQNSYFDRKAVAVNASVIVTLLTRVTKEREKWAVIRDRKNEDDRGWNGNRREARRSEEHRSFQWWIAK